MACSLRQQGISADYWYCTYRYFDNSDQTKTSTEHLLKHTEHIKGQVHKRLWLDLHYISRPVPHDHKLVDRELDKFSIALRQGITTLYLRKVVRRQLKVDRCRLNEKSGF